MEILEFSDLSHNKAPFLTVGGFLFSVPGISHWADHLHDKSAKAPRHSSHTSKNRHAPGPAVLGGFKSGNPLAVLLELRDHDAVEAG